jgi:hypothetical protein
LEGSGTPVLYIGRTVLKGSESLRVEINTKIVFYFLHTDVKLSVSVCGRNKNIIHKVWENTVAFCCDVPLHSTHERNSTEITSIVKSTTTLIGQMIHGQRIAAYWALLGH